MRLGALSSKEEYGMLKRFFGRPGPRVAVLVAALMFAMGVHTPAAVAAGGGCSPPDGLQNGWDVAVCSSDNGVRVSADVYVNVRGSLGSSCFVRYMIYDKTDGQYVKVSANESCAFGHKPQIHAPKVRGHRYYTVGQVAVNNSWVFQAKSLETY
jgi:hypothetical protein